MGASEIERRRRARRPGLFIARSRFNFSKLGPLAKGVGMGKKDVDVSMEEEEEESVVVLSPIANPLAKDKLVKKILKLVKAGERRNSLLQADPTLLDPSLRQCTASTCKHTLGSAP